MVQNEYRALIDKGANNKGILKLHNQSTLMACQKLTIAQFEALTKQLNASYLVQAKSQQVEVLRCELYGVGHNNAECVFEEEFEQVNYIGNYQKENPFSNTYNPTWKDHLSLKWINNLGQDSFQNQQSRKPSQLEETFTQFTRITQNSIQDMKVSTETAQKKA